MRSPAIFELRPTIPSLPPSLIDMPGVKSGRSWLRGKLAGMDTDASRYNCAFFAEDVVDDPRWVRIDLTWSPPDPPCDWR